MKKNINRQNPTFLAFRIYKPQAISGIKQLKPTFLHFNWMVKERARPKNSNFKLSFFSLSTLSRELYFHSIKTEHGITCTYQCYQEYIRESMQHTQ